MMKGLMRAWRRARRARRAAGLARGRPWGVLCVCVVAAGALLLAGRTVTAPWAPARVELRFPAPGARLDAPPVLSWEARGCEALCVVLGWLHEPGRGLVAASEFVHGRTYWQMSEAWWSRVTKDDREGASRWMVYCRDRKNGKLVFDGPREFVPLSGEERPRPGSPRDREPGA